MAKEDNFEKHEEKRICLENGVPLKHLKKDNTYIKANCKHLKFVNLWTKRKLDSIAI